MVKNKFKAFTLLEVVVVLGVFFMITMFLFPIAIGQLQGNKTDIELRSIISAIGNQSENAFTNKANSNYGIAFFSDHYILYTGDNLATAVSKDQYNFNADVIISEINFSNSGSELNFEKGSFRPNTFGSFKIKTGILGYTVTINSEGLIGYSKL
jgi:type II secretory pathway pseudopilin PulG